MNKIYVVAGTHQEYQTFMHKKAKELWDKGVTEITLSHFVYVDSVEKLRGLTECNGYYIGTYKQRPDLNEIQTQIQIIKARQANKIFNPIATEVLDQILGNEIRGAIVDEMYNSWVNNKNQIIDEWADQ